MNTPPRRRPAPPAWHASPALLSAYAGGRAGPADAWSLEAHLTDCALCRAELALVLAPTDVAALADSRHRLLASLPEQAPVRSRLRAHGWWRWGLRPSALIAVVVAVAAAGLLDALSASTGGSGRGASGLLWLLAPAIPLIGVALCAVGDGDPCREVVLSTPSAVLRLTLWRSLTVLLLAVPLAFVAGWLAADGWGGGGQFRWLLPALALVAAALALGTVVPLERAAVALAGGWCLVATGPALASAGPDARALLASLATTEAPVLLQGPAQGGWLAVAFVAFVVLVLRRKSFGELALTSGRNR